MFGSNILIGKKKQYLYLELEYQMYERKYNDCSLVRHKNQKNRVKLDQYLVGHGDENLD